MVVIAAAGILWILFVDPTQGFLGTLTGWFTLLFGRGKRERSYDKHRKKTDRMSSEDIARDFDRLTDRGK